MQERALALVEASPYAGERAGIGEAEFEEIVRLNQRRIYRLLLALVRDPDAADNLTQECFLRAYQKRASFRGEASVATWLAHIAVNLARDHARSRRNHFWRRLLAASGEEAHETATQLSDGHRSPEQVLLARERLAQVLAAVETLSPQQREIVVLRFVEEMPLEQIAQVLGTAAGTVKCQLSRGVARLRRRLQEVESQ